MDLVFIVGLLSYTFGVVRGLDKCIQRVIDCLDGTSDGYLYPVDVGHLDCLDMFVVRDGITIAHTGETSGPVKELNFKYIRTSECLNLTVEYKCYTANGCINYSVTGNYMLKPTSSITGNDELEPTSNITIVRDVKVHNYISIIIVPAIIIIMIIIMHRFMACKDKWKMNQQERNTQYELGNPLKEPDPHTRDDPGGMQSDSIMLNEINITTAWSSHNGGHYGPDSDPATCQLVPVNVNGNNDLII